MDAPRTATGSPCKLCLKKGLGGRCHLHGGTPGSPSGTSDTLKSSGSSKKYSGTKSYANLDDLFGTFDSPSKRKSPPKIPTEFHYLINFDKDLLSEVLLRMDWVSLSRVCHYVAPSVKKIRNICKDPSFQQKYLARNRKPLFNKPVLELQANVTKVVIFSDGDRASSIDIKYKDSDKKIRAQIVTVNFLDYAFAFRIELVKNGIISFVQSHDAVKYRTEQDMFDAIGRSSWGPLYRKGPKSIERVRVCMELIEELEQALTGLVPTKFFDTILTEGNKLIKKK